VYPGRISRDYLDGRRARFIPPFRLYVFASLVFFVLLPLVTGQWDRFTADGPGLGEAREQVEQAREAGSISEEEYQEALDGLNQLEGLWQGGVPGLVAPSPPAADASEEGSADGESAVAADLAAGGWSGFMVAVFDVMAISGSSDARAMSAGVARATIPTMAGMVSALSGLIFSSQIERLAKRRVHELADELEVG